jgi:hypothetical protein
MTYMIHTLNVSKGNNKTTELRTIFQREDIDNLNRASHVQHTDTKQLVLTVDTSNHTLKI